MEELLLDPSVPWNRAASYGLAAARHDEDSRLAGVERASGGGGTGGKLSTPRVRKGVGAQHDPPSIPYCAAQWGWPARVAIASRLAPTSAAVGASLLATGSSNNPQEPVGASLLAMGSNRIDTDRLETL